MPFSDVEHRGIATKDALCVTFNGRRDEAEPMPDSTRTPPQGVLAIVAAESMSLDLVGYPTFHTLANFSVVAAIAVGTHRAATTRGR
jgi:hypothetical protein